MKSPEKNPVGHPYHLEFSGLTAAEVEESRLLHGPNVLTPPPRVSWWKLYLEKFEDPIIRILLVAAVIAILAGLVEGHYVEGIGIIIAVLLATTLGFINEYKAGQEFDVLNQVSDSEAIKVIREGQYTSTTKKDLVVGDVVVLEQGEEIPADAELLSAVSFQVNEASLTGESVPVTKRPASDTAHKKETELAYPRHQVLRGTFVSDGHALVRVTSVGDNSEIGRTARAASEETETTTPLNRQLTRLGQVIGVCGFGVALLIFSALTIRAGLHDDLGRQVVLATIPITSEAELSPTTLEEALNNLRPQYGDLVDQWPVSSRLETDERIYYLNVPLSGGQLYILIMVFVSMMAALNRIWLPVVHDAIELVMKKRPECAWMEQEGLKPWLISVAIGGTIFGLSAAAGVGMGWLPATASDWIPISTSMEILRFFMVAVTIIVVAVPEGLPMSVTLSLAYSMRKMTAANNLVRRLHACETIGAATVICSDKTGTLTMNEMRVSSYVFTNKPEDKNNSRNQEWSLTAEAIAANTTANLGVNDEGQLIVPLGNPTECALLLWLEDHKESYQATRDTFKVDGQLTFSTERKYMATIGSGLLSGDLTLHVKGAPEIILAKSKYCRLPDGQVVDLGARERDEIVAALRTEQARGMRALGFAYNRMAPGSHKSEEYGPDEIQNMVESAELIWLGFFSIADPVRPEVPQAIRDCARAGVLVKMVTGDNQATAREIATEIGLMTAEDHAAELMVAGDDFMAMDQETAEKTVRNIKIMSRAKPLAKQRLVTLLQKQGQVVAVTGDGSNDAPALNHADVGLAMGKTGTSVAKEAADIILLDDSFASIVKAVMWGRSLYANIQKFILFQLTINVSALGIALLGPFLGIQLPLTVTQMLWVNLIMDTFAALALATEPPDWAVMEKPPRDPQAFIVTPEMAKFIFTAGGIFLAMFLVLALGLAHVFPMNTETVEGQHNLSIFFSAFVFLQFWNLFNARMLGQTRSAFSRLSESRLFLTIALVIAAGQILITQVGGEVFRTVPLSATEWVYIIVGTSPVLWLGEIIRWFQRSGSGSDSQALRT